MAPGGTQQVRRRGPSLVGGAALPLTAIAGFLLLNGGCGSKPDYPPNLPFPSRSDRLVLKTPETPPTAPNNAEKLTEELAKLDGLGGKTVAPTSLPAATRTALDRYLRDAFGTPAAPTVNADPETNTAAERLGLSAENLA